ncbi:hypothetical protein [Pontibacter cellulosilyticus]|uniref:DUF4296 domain-containing protein n=1 Tax=Pontibacter cellulosilyticus TaxID=1720253 RepID=A0A923N7L5_9BACT|nr:hypothetical protein [Pontibacter cellulosilyticus]MBC5993696.1 hypothetical protein [Pontibacter cellulosilyticus]
MKKAFNIVLAAGILFFASSCMEDSGTSFETEESNNDERVNPNHIRPYSSLDSLSRMIQMTTATVPTNGQLATEMVKAYYISDQDASGIIEQFNLNQTTRMVGQAGDIIDESSATDPREQESMVTVQDSLNEVTGDKNTESAKPEQNNPNQKTTTGTQKQSDTSKKTNKQ